MARDKKLREKLGLGQFVPLKALAPEPSDLTEEGNASSATDGKFASKKTPASEENSQDGGEE